MGCTAGKDTAVIHVEYESIMTATIVKDTVIAFLPKTAIKIQTATCRRRPSSMSIQMRTTFSQHDKQN